MKKISVFILTLCLTFSLSACSSKSDEDVQSFFSALNKTMQLDSAQVTGSLEMTTPEQSAMDYTLEFNQTSDLQLALSVDISSGNNKVEDFIQFYIKDGKTYLDNLGTTSQSTVENLGMSADSKLYTLNPFLSYTNEELSDFFTATNVNGDTYTMTIDTSSLSTLLDSYGSVAVSKADITAVIQDGIIKSCTFYIEGDQSVDSASFSFTIQLTAKVKNINEMDQIDFPDDLDAYGSEEE